MNLEPIAARLRQEEGLRLTPYKDTEGVWTIGYGTNITTISREEAEMLLQHRLGLAADAVLGALPWAAALDEVRLGILIDMTYNMGVAGLMQFNNTLLKIRTGDWEGAAKGMLASLWAEQVGQRAVRLAEMMETGKSPTENIA
jgi:lysozyme